MKLPNGFGSVYKLSGKRRKPFVARKTVGWEFNDATKKSYPIYQFIGYYETRKEALNALVQFNNDPHDTSKITFAELYERWSEEYFQDLSKSRISAYTIAFKDCKKVHDIEFTKLKLVDYQYIIDTCDKTINTCKIIKMLINAMYEYAVKLELVSREKHLLMSYIDLSKVKEANYKVKHKSIAKQDIQILWDNINEETSIILILIYTGLRCGELFDLKTENVHLDDRCFLITKSKTSNGIREVPIAEKIVPLIQFWLNKNTEYFITTKRNCKITYTNFLAFKLPKVNELLNDDYTLHDTRHTCATLLNEANIDLLVTKRILGHSVEDLTENVYTHIDLKTKLEAINKI